MKQLGLTSNMQRNDYSSGQHGKILDGCSGKGVDIIKIRKAKELIKKGYLKNYSIEALAQSSGFKATNTFYRLFKKETGITPKMFSDNF